MTPHEWANVAVNNCNNQMMGDREEFSCVGHLEQVIEKAVMEERGRCAKIATSMCGNCQGAVSAENCSIAREIRKAPKANE